MSMFIKNEEDIQEILSQEIDKSINTSSVIYSKDKEPREVWQEEIFDEILKSYDKKYGTDFQQELRAYIKPVAMERIRASLDGKNINAIKKEEQKELSDESKNLSKEGIALDDNSKKELEKNVEENEEKGQQVNIRAEALKAVYSSTLEEYYKLKNQLQLGENGQVETGSLSVGNKKGTELVMYEKYLHNIDTRYRAMAGVSLLKDDDKIKETESKFALNNEKNEKIINEKFGKNIDEVNRLLEEREAIEEQMAVVISQRNMLSAEDFKSQIDGLQEDYLETTAKLHTIEPNIHELMQDIEMHDKDERFRDRTLGDEFSKYHNKSLDEKVGRDDKANDNNLDKVTNDFYESTNDNFVTTQDAAQETLDDYFKAEERGDSKSAEEILQSAETMSGTTTAERKTDESDRTDVTEQEEYNKVQNENAQEKKSSKLFDPRLNAVASDEEREAQEQARLQKEQEDRKSRAEDVQEQINENQNNERTLYNNRRRY